MNIQSGIYEKGTITLEQIYAEIRKHPQISKAGDIVSFTGIVRGVTSSGDAVSKIKIEAYKEPAEKALRSICDDLRKINGIIEVVIVHLVGEFNVGEDMVYVVIAGAHREESFAALTQAVNRYKKEAPLWKKEFLVSGKSYWIEEPHKS
ncbi:MAG: molybdenum cofactor biosynthesis protein MoaE [Candidatus Helarchaeota archaeon]